jgi:hypothetical protein
VLSPDFEDQFFKFMDLLFAVYDTTDGIAMKLKGVGYFDRSVHNVVLGGVHGNRFRIEIDGNSFQLMP